MIILKGKSVEKATQLIDGNSLEDHLRELRKEEYLTGEISEMFGVGYSTVQGWMRKLGIQYTSTESNNIMWKRGLFDRETSRQNGINMGKGGKGRTSHRKGKKLSDEHRANISKGQTGLRVGKNHPSWKGGGTPRYGGGWKKAKREARKRAGDTCEICNTHENDLISSDKLDVHHKMPMRYFSEPSEAHYQSNLIVLCRSCHMKEEHKGRDELPLFTSSHITVPLVKKKIILRICEYCDNEYEIKKKSQKYCCRDCADKSQIKPIEKRKCPVCKNTYIPCYSKQVSCSTGCSNTRRSRLKTRS